MEAAKFYTQVTDPLSWAIQALARAQGQGLDPLRLNSCLQGCAQIESRPEQLKKLANLLGVSSFNPLESPDPARLPALVCVAGEWGLLEQWLPNNQWLVTTQSESKPMDAGQLLEGIFWLDFRGEEGSVVGGKTPVQTFRQAFRATMRPYRGAIFESVFASAFIGFITLAISMYSMQVYDRVIPTRTMPTLITLGLGVAIAILLELCMKYARSHIMQAVTAGVDSRSSREIFERLMAVRLDALPSSVGSLAAQLRGYEQVRAYYTASTLFAIVDIPLGLLMIGVLALLGGPLVAAVPAAFALLALILGFAKRREVMRHAAEATNATNLKTGLLVEALEGAETIKAGSGGWKFLSRWIDINRVAMLHDMKLKQSSDSLGFMSASLQQLAYAGLVSCGAWQVMQGNMTTGALIACSIVSGRLMAPILGLPGIMVQHAHSESALKGLEALYELPRDNQNVARPLVPQKIRGQFALHGAKFSYPDSPLAIQAERIEIQPGERVAIIGAIGSGKSTLLKLMAGLYCANEGKVFIDGLDANQISRAALSQSIAVLQQEHRLFQGSLRDNLLIGLSDPGDDMIRAAMERSGLLALVTQHPKGLDLPIFEGGRGLSGGQRQLVAFTRLLLTKPSVLMLDEPTANMDEAQERRCLAVLKEEMERPWHDEKRRTCIIVTHKGSLIPIVDRIIVVQNQRVILDGPREAVLARLMGPEKAAPVNKVNPPSAPAANVNFAPRVVNVKSASTV